MVVAAVAVLNYAVATGARPSLVCDGPLTPERAEDWADDPREVPIYDARRALTPLALEGAGFVLMQHGYGVMQPGRSVCFAQAEGIAHAATGAVRVVAFDWSRRTRDPPTPNNMAVGAPVLRVHCDFTPRSALETLLPLQLLDREVAGSVARYAILSVWWPIQPVNAWPLALADARTVATDDLIPMKRIHPNSRGELGFVAYRSAHRWFTFPGMQPDEALVFKLFDSSSSVARWTPHSAFRDPSTPAGAKPRESVEVRVLAVY